MLLMLLLNPFTEEPTTPIEDAKLEEAVLSEDCRVCISETALLTELCREPNLLFILVIEEFMELI